MKSFLVVSAVFVGLGFGLAGGGLSAAPATATNAAPSSLIFLTHDRVVFSIAFSPAGDLLAAASLDGAVSLWWTQGILRKKIRLHDKMVLAIAFRPDGEAVASASADGTVAIFDLKGRLEKRLTGHLTNVISVAWSPDGRLVASGADDRRILVQEQGGRLVTILTGEVQAPTSIAFTPDGKTMVVAERGQYLLLYDTKTWKAVRKIKAHQDVIWDVAVTVDGMHLATASKDRTVGIWNRTGEPVASIGGFSDEIWTLDWSPDGRQIACGLKNGELVVVDVAGRKIGLILRSHKTGIPGISWSSTGKLVATGSRDGTIRLWKGI